MRESYTKLVLKHSNIIHGYVTLEVLPEHYSYKKKWLIEKKFHDMGSVMIVKLFKQYYPEKLI